MNDMSAIGAARAARRALGENRAILILVALQVLAAIMVRIVTGVPYTFTLIQLLAAFVTTLIPIFLFILVIWRCLVLARMKHDLPAGRVLWLDIKAKCRDADRVIGGAVTAICFSVFMAVFPYLKGAIPALVPFSWDPFMAALDRAILGGVDAWEPLFAIFGAPVLLTTFNISYHAWFFVMYFIIFTACFSRSNLQARAQFFLAFMLTWIIGGNLLATIFSSAGPAYYHLLGLGNQFAPLMDSLRAANDISPVWALRVQDTLWEGYVGTGRISGISAFPSMHVASTTVMALYAASYARWAGRAMTVFLGFIALGSVLLGWHYAVDAFAGVALALLFWRISPYLLGQRSLPRFGAQPVTS